MAKSGPGRLTSIDAHRGFVIFLMMAEVLHLGASWCFLLLAGFYGVIDVQGWRGYAFPLVVIGMNSIAAYCIAHLWESFLVSTFKTHLCADYASVLGSAYAPLVPGGLVLGTFWLILFWFHQRRIFLRI